MSGPEALETAFFKELIPAAGPDSEVALNLLRASDLLFSHLDRTFRTHGMSEAQFNVLVTLEDQTEGMTMVEIARRMLISRAGISGLVRGLERKGWVERTPCPGDARAFRIRLTGAGRRALEEVLPDHLTAVHGAIGVLSEADKRRLVTILTRLRGHLACVRAQGEGWKPA